MSDYLRKWILEAHGEERGSEIANLAEREGYQFNVPSGALYVGEDTVWPVGYDIDKVFPLNKDARARPAYYDSPSSWTLFLARSKEIKAPAYPLVKLHYVDLVATYFDWGLPKPGALADLRALREETQRAIEHSNNSLERLFSEARCYLAVMFLEAYRRAPEESQAAVDYRFREGTWLYVLTGVDWDSISFKVVEEFEDFPGTPPEIAQIQSPAIVALLERRNRVIAKVLPVEIRRIACENILAKIVRGDAVKAWSEKDEESLLPFREDLKCQSREAREAIFDLYDILNEDEYRKTEWTHHNQIYQALATQKAKGMPTNIARVAYMDRETDRLRQAVRRTLDHRGEGDVLHGENDAQIARQLRDWLIELGSAHAPKWRAREPF